MSNSNNLEWLNAEIANPLISTVPSTQHQEDSGFHRQAGDEKSEVFNLLLFSSIRLRTAEIKHISLSSKYIYIITSDNQALRWELDSQDKAKEPKKESMEELIIRAPSLEMNKVFCDPTGFHTLIAMASSDTHYIHETATKSSLVSKLHGYSIESVCFNQKSEYLLTKEVLLGTATGLVLELALEYDKTLDSVKGVSLIKLIELPYTLPVYGLQYEIYPGVPSKVSVMAATVSCLYQFFGDANDQRKAEFNRIFEKYRSNPSLITSSVHEVGAEIEKSQLQFYYKRSRAESFAWMSGSGLMYGKFASNASEELFVTKMTPLPYPLRENDEVIGIAITAYHTYLLFKRELCVFSKLNHELVHTVNFDLRTGHELKGVVFDLETHSLTVWSNRFVYKLMIENEGKDVWKYYADQGLYEEAVDFCKQTSSPALPKVTGLLADSLYKKGKQVEAAAVYAESDKDFETCCLKLVDNSTALQKFLESELKLMGAELKTQRTLVTTWLAEIYLYNINCVYIDDDDTRVATEEDFRTFLSLHSNDLDAITVYTLLQTHGRIEDWVYFAELKGNFEMVILHHMNQQEFVKALTKLEHVDSLSRESLLYRYSPIFMQNEPEMTVKLLMDTAVERRGILDLKRLIPGLLNVPIELRNHAIKFELFCVQELGMKDKNLHNLLIFHLAENDPPMLSKYLLEEEAKSNLGFDTEYALSVFKLNNCIDALILLYGMLNMHSEAVSIALEHGFFALAKENAQKLENIDESLARRVWLKIAIFMVKNSDIESALEIMHESKLVKMEDLLPYFDDKLSISNFNAELCTALNGYKESIEELQEDLLHSTRSREIVREDIYTSKHSCIELEVLQLCEICGKFVILKNFYIYPCVHAYHKDCLIEVLMPILELRDYIRAKELKAVLDKLQTLESVDGEPHPLEESLDKILAPTCYLCSTWFIESIKDNMLDNAFEIDSWGIN